MLKNGSMGWIISALLVACVIGQSFLLLGSSRDREPVECELAHSQEERALQLELSLDAQRRTIAEQSRDLFMLRREIRGLESLLEGSQPRASELDPPALSPDTAALALTERPRVEEIPILSDEELSELIRRKSRMPRFGHKQIVAGDVDSILADLDWNPSERALAAEERIELERLMKDYRFFSMTSRMERLENVVIPLVDEMRESGEYVEYPEDEPPPRIEGASITHSEPAGDGLHHRLYAFFETDYPELYHDHVVEDQRSIEAVVEMYELINSRVSAASR